jgi:uncharacterized protein involved in exopolysaccharide biosynthesis
MNEPQDLAATSRPSGTDNDEIDLGQLIATVAEHKFTIILMAVIATLLGYGYADLATPIYRADGVIQIEQKPGFAAKELASVFALEEGNTAVESLDPAFAHPDWPGRR